MTNSEGSDFEDRVRRAIASGVPMDIDKVDLDATFGELGLESLDVVNIIFGLETEFGVAIETSDFEVGAAGSLTDRPMRELVEVTKAVVERPKA